MTTEPLSDSAELTETKLKSKHLQSESRWGIGLLMVLTTVAIMSVPLYGGEISLVLIGFTCLYAILLPVWFSHREGWATVKKYMDPKKGLLGDMPVSLRSQLAILSMLCLGVAAALVIRANATDGSNDRFALEVFIIVMTAYLPLITVEIGLFRRHGTSIEPDDVYP